MKMIYGKETDTLSIILHPGAVAESDEVREGLILDYDKAGRLVSLELHLANNGRSYAVLRSA